MEFGVTAAAIKVLHNDHFRCVRPSFARGAEVREMDFANINEVKKAHCYEHTH